MKPDDLMVGQYITVTNLNNDDDDYEPMQYDMFGRRVKRAEQGYPEGLPMKVLVVSLPYIGVLGKQLKFYLDTRKVDLHHSSEEFFDLFEPEKPNSNPVKKFLTPSQLIRYPQYRTE